MNDVPRIRRGSIAVLESIDGKARSSLNRVLQDRKLSNFDKREEELKVGPLDAFKQNVF